MKAFQLLIKPVAADCNLECGYCFYRPVNNQFGGHGVSHRMSTETLERLISDYLSHRFETSVLCWQGGEPTLAGLDFFRKVVNIEMRNGRGGQLVGNAFQTNGLLIDDDWAKFLAEYKFLVGLSLDGPGDIHDSFRKTRGGHGSFERVMAATERLRRHGAAFNILAVVSSASQGHAARIYRFFRKQGFNQLQFIPCLERDSTGEPSEFSISPHAYGQFLTDLFDEWKRDDPASVSIRTFDCFMNVATGGEPDLCVYRRRCGEYLLIEHNGDVYPCDFFVAPSRRLGNIADKPLSGFFEMKRHRQFARGKQKIDPSCKTCEWRRQCNGGCPKDRMAGNGADAGKTLFCDAYKRFFAHSMGDFRRMAIMGGSGREKGVERAARKPGRNDPCPCGSGLKYKKCCL